MGRRHIFAAFFGLFPVLAHSLPQSCDQATCPEIFDNMVKAQQREQYRICQIRGHMGLPGSLSAPITTPRPCIYCGTMFWQAETNGTHVQ
jgi:hypothetical protein